MVKRKSLSGNIVCGSNSLKYNQIFIKKSKDERIYGVDNVLQGERGSDSVELRAQRLGEAGEGRETVKLGVKSRTEAVKEAESLVEAAGERDGRVQERRSFSEAGNEREKVKFGVKSCMEAGKGAESLVETTAERDGIVRESGSLSEAGNEGGKVTLGVKSLMEAGKGAESLVETTGERDGRVRERGSLLEAGNEGKKGKLRTERFMEQMDVDEGSMEEKDSFAEESSITHYSDEEEESSVTQYSNEEEESFMEGNEAENQGLSNDSKEEEFDYSEDSEEFEEDNHENNDRENEECEEFFEDSVENEELRTYSSLYSDEEESFMEGNEREDQEFSNYSKEEEIDFSDNSEECEENSDDDDGDDDDDDGESEKFFVDCEEKEELKNSSSLSVKEICQKIKSKDKNMCLKALKSCKNHLTEMKKRYIEKYYKHGVIETLVYLIKNSTSVNEIDRYILDYSISIMSNMTMGQSRHIAAVVKHGGLDLFIQLIDHEDDSICISSLIGLVFITGDLSLYRSIIVAKRFLSMIEEMIHRFWSNINVLTDLSRLILNICEHNSDYYSINGITKVFPIIYELMSKQNDIELQIYLSRAIFHAIKNEYVIYEVILNNLLHCIDCNLSRSESRLILESLYIITAVISSSETYISSAIDAGLLVSMKTILSNGSCDVVKEACKLLTIISHFEDHVMTLVNSGIMRLVLNIIDNGHRDSQKEALRLINSVVLCGKDYPKVYLLNNDVLKSLVPILHCKSTEVIVLILKTIKRLLDNCKSYNEYEKNIKVLIDVGGRDIIEDLQNLSGEVYTLSCELGHLYFDTSL